VIAGVALDGDAGDALESLGEVLVREAGNILGDDGVDRGNRFALQVERGIQRSAKAGHDDVGLGCLRIGRLGLGDSVGGLGGGCGCGGGLGFSPRRDRHGGEGQDRRRAEHAGKAALA